MAKGTKLTGRTIVITGAGSGIGRALAQRFSGMGSPVAIADWNEDGLAETVDSLKGPVLSKKLDVRDKHAQMAFASEVKDWAPTSIGAVINNAGVTVSQPVEGASEEDDDWVIDVNLNGVLHGCRSFLPILKAQPDGGAIVNVSSIFGFMGWPTQSAYCASKGAVKGYTEALRHELRGSNVQAYCVHPGGIKTNIVRNARFHVDDQGNTDRTIMERDFDAIAFTSPAKAAATIHKGVESGNPRILIGADAHLISALVRVAPARYFDVVERLEPLMRKSMRGK